MDHEVVVREKMTEKYVLEELDPALREEFEDHFFDCPDCAFDVRAASALAEHSKEILKEHIEAVPVRKNARVLVSASPGWFAWLRPAFAVPVMALLLVVIGYQNLVTLPQLGKALHKPQILPAATLNLLTYGANAAPLTIHAGQGFLLNVIVPPGHHYPAYRVDLYNPAGKIEASIPVKDSPEDTWSIGFPESNRQSGTYKLAVHGLTDSGQDVEVGTSSFELQIQK
ncbi:MAG TPA: zf-HC2 domain-containing protein [Candidatus Sulfotelmatobacter sp.]